MNLKIYQAYYDEAQLPNLDPVFLPFDNTNNSTPHLREYPMWQKLYEEHKDTDAHWGLMSWRWLQKTNLPPAQFRDWILANPGYDVYHIDPFPDLPNQYMNIWTQGDVWCPGMNDFCNRLFPKLGIHIQLSSSNMHQKILVLVTIMLEMLHFGKVSWVFLTYV